MAFCFLRPPARSSTRASSALSVCDFHDIGSSVFLKIVDAILMSDSIGAGARNRDGKEVAPVLKEGDKVLLPEFGGTAIKVKEQEFVIYREDDILAVLKEE